MMSICGKRYRRRSIAAASVFTVLLFLVTVPGCSWFGSSKGENKENAKQPEVLTCPLCGMKVSDRSLIDRRPLAVKVENDPAARPQSGLDKACVIYEEITEGGITRFMAVYLCHDADVVGPVRSARPVDIDLASQFQALLCHCGGAPPTISAIRSSGIADLDEQSGTGAYWRSKDRRAPHNLYTGTERLRADGNVKYPFEGEVGQAFQFLDDKGVHELERVRAEEAERLAKYQADPQGEFQPKLNLANGIEIPYTKVCAVSYNYDTAAAGYLRFIRGVPHTDMTTGEQLTADTIIVQYVVESTSGIKDVRGADTPDLGVVGSGRAQIFMIGQCIDAEWSKSSRQDYTRYYDYDGNEIQIKPGRIWVQLVPLGKEATYR
ncbi:MAG: DUF3048 domain-containing protein [Actinobacteria bacterium]|nr:DUF3048 domain-containing protein [Actinomycetota bacterium]